MVRDLPPASTGCRWPSSWPRPGCGRCRSSEVAGRLDDRFRLLTGGSRTALPRHQTLRAVVEWSWDLLDRAERRLADRLSVFAGGVGADAAERVCAGPDVPADEVLDLLARAGRQVAAGGGSAAPSRATGCWRRSGSTARSGSPRPASAEDDPAGARGVLPGSGREAEPHLRSPEQLGWLARLTAERDNLLAALRFAVDAGDADTAVRLGAALAWYWTVRSEHGTAATWLAAVADLPGPAPAEARAVCLALGAISYAAAEHDFARLTGPMARAKELSSAKWTSHPLLGLLDLVAALIGGDEEKALETLATRAEPSNPWARATGDFLAALLYENAGRFEEHRERLTRALAGFRQVGRPVGAGVDTRGPGWAPPGRRRPGGVDGRLRGGPRSDGRDHRERGRVLHADPAGRRLCTRR